ncbi:MAG: hypothetical protein MK105_05835 [Crocinitomicaceae bacterium]|nr:hypothetical protein [Crocinitomicaceae bacterium]
MKTILFLSILFIAGFSISQTREVIKIEVSKDCKTLINKRTYIDEIYTKPINLVSTLNMKCQLVLGYVDNFIYQNNGLVLYLKMEENFFREYDIKDIYLIIDNEEKVFNKLIVFDKHELKLSTGTITSYTLGFELSEAFKSKLSKAEDIKFELINRNSGKRKSWSIGNIPVDQINRACDCLDSHYKPLEARLIEQKKHRDSEYQKSLKSYETNYRKSVWGDSKETVLETEEKEPVLSKNNSLAYQVRLNNDDFLAFFYFHNDRLHQGVYSFEGEFVNENNFYSKYLELKRILTKKYGEPKEVKQHRSGELYDGASEIGMAIQTGEYTELTSWETINSTIKLIISGENFDSKITIRYNTKDLELSKEVEKANSLKSIEGF